MCFTSFQGVALQGDRHQRCRRHPPRALHGRSDLFNTYETHRLRLLKGLKRAVSRSFSVVSTLFLARVQAARPLKTLMALMYQILKGRRAFRQQFLDGEKLVDGTKRSKHHVSYRALELGPKELTEMRLRPVSLKNQVLEAWGSKRRCAGSKKGM